MPKIVRGLLAAVAVIGMALGAAACGPGHAQPKKSSTGPGGY
jgi:hypothetical protein